MRFSRDTINGIRGAAKRLAHRNKEKYGWTFELHGLKRQAARLLALFRRAMYPGIFGGGHADRCGEKTVKRHLISASGLLFRVLGKVMPETGKERISAVVREFVAGLGGVAECLESDVRAAYEGDPAARTEREIMLSYPAFEAISVYRLAHALHRLGVPLVPRMMTEYAHGATGIDIHPGAEIGRRFFIDHGTGVVIGETCVIGEHVKLYQGVTLGAKSFELDEEGNPIKGIKRHPNIGSNVVIYAGATILGGDTVIGDNCVIGGNVWLTHSVEAGKKVFYNNGGE